jgi:triosephosphate isomerase
LRKIMIAGNWKMNHTVKDTEQFFHAFSPEMGKAELLFCVPFTDLPAVSELLKNTDIHWGAENVFPEEKGAYTGEISPSMLTELGCSYVICGHSERRQILGETNAFIAKKIKAVFAAKMTPILCVGEGQEQRKANETEKFLKEELDSALKDLTKEQIAHLVIAYEPIWAIGSGEAATPETAEETARFIRQTAESYGGSEAAGAVRILYGGSVKSSNIMSFLHEPDIDGALIGGASLDPAEMIDIYKKACSI